MDKRDLNRRKKRLNKFSRKSARILKKAYRSGKLYSYLGANQSNGCGVFFLLLLALIYLGSLLYQYKDIIQAFPYYEYLGGGALILVYLIYRWIRIRINFRNISFSLVKYVGEISSGEHNHQVLSTLDHHCKKRFSYINLIDFPSLNEGDVAVAIMDSNRNLLGVIHLKKHGKIGLSTYGASPDYHEDSLRKMSEEVKDLVAEFISNCKMFENFAGLEYETLTINANKKSSPVKDIPKDLNKVWESIAISESLKGDLFSQIVAFEAGDYGASQGTLLYGPPGTGKTLLATKIAESLGCPLIALSLSDVKRAHIGESAQAVSAIWNEALGHERAVIFVDECETMFADRGSTKSDSFTDEVVTTFLSKWDGFTKQNSVWVIGATNKMSLIDSAVLSRFSEQTEIGLPKPKEREIIFINEFKKAKLDVPIDSELVEASGGFSGRDIQSSVRTYLRKNGGSSFDQVKLLKVLSENRKSGSTKVDKSASWQNLILADETLNALKLKTELFKDSEKWKAKGVTIPRGILLWGPPGTGKTQIAKTFANESGLTFLSATSSDLKAGFIGQSAGLVKSLFEKVKSNAPCILFIDEIDVVAPSRGAINKSDAFTNEIVGQLLQELDGVSSINGEVFVLAATNNPDHIDSALLSRFPEKIHIPLPDANARYALLKHFLADKPLADELTSEFQREVVLLWEGASGRDIRSKVESGEQSAIMRAMNEGGVDHYQLDVKDFT